MIDDDDIWPPAPVRQPVPAAEAEDPNGSGAADRWQRALGWVSLLLTAPGLLLNIGTNVCHYFGPNIWLFLPDDQSVWFYVAGWLRVINPFFGGLLGLGSRSTLPGKFAMAVAVISYAVFFAFAW